MIRKTLIVAFCLLVGACSLMVDRNTHDYPQASKDAFLQSCTTNSGGKKELCSCLLTKVEEHYTYGEMTDLEDKIKKGQQPQEFTDFMAKAGQECMSGSSSAKP
jgi:hypothetical protein